MCEWWDFCRGFSIEGARHKIDLKITRKARGLFAKRPYLQPPDRNTRTGASQIQELELAHQIHGVPSS
jgi:hypothetical protein